jgi:hypothetical protein
MTNVIEPYYHRIKVLERFLIKAKFYLTFWWASALSASGTFGVCAPRIPALGGVLMNALNSRVG